MSDVQSPAARKKTQKFVAIAVLVVVLGVAFGSAFLDSKKQPTQAAPTTPPVTKSINPPGTIDAKEAWMNVSNQNIKKVEEHQQEIEQDNQKLRKELTDTQKMLAERLQKLESGASIAPNTAPITTSMTTGRSMLPPPPPPQKTGAALPPSPTIQPVRASVASAQNPGQQVQISNQAQYITLPETGGIASGSMDEGVVTKRDNQVSQNSGTNTTAKKKKTAANYIPSGSFAKAATIGGLTAPTGGTAQANPLPIFFLVTDDAILPNQYRFQTKNCHVIGAGYGDLSAERVNVRLESMSCVLEDGTSIDVDIKGYVTDQDGKAGLAGRLVEKTGRVLANAVFAGVASGLGQAVATNSQSTVISSLGTATSVTNPGQAFQSGLGTGLSKSMDKLANYYISLAEKMFPVIEVDAGRKVDIIITKGVSLDIDGDLTKTSSFEEQVREARGDKRREWIY